MTLAVAPPDLDPHRLFANLEVPADWMGLRIVRETQTDRTLRDGKPQRNGQTTTWGAMVEVWVAGQMGYGATNRLDPAGLQQAAEMAYQQAQAAQDWGIPATPLPRPAAQGRYLSPYQRSLTSLSAGEINDLLAQICEHLRVSDQIVRTIANLTTTEAETWWLTTDGADIYQRVLHTLTHYEATSQVGAVVQQRSDNGMVARCYQGGLECFLSPDLWNRVTQIGEQALELAQAAECPIDTTTLVLAPDQMMLQIHESIGHPLELDRILGDERNYAGSSFVRPADFGHLQYGSPLMNVTFDPTVPGELASYPFDDTGVPAGREYLIREGVLLRGLGSLESQARSGLPGVACARACSWNRPPIDRMANLNLEPGEGSLAEVIAPIEAGIYMEANRSWSIDDYRRKFQFGCEYARRIENGQLTEVLRNPNYRGTTLEFWNRLSRVGGPQTWAMFGSPYCGKGEPNQAIRVGHGSPVCVFEGIEVFGGG
ncbi:MAG: TldD/PmbA family protein [Gloeomargaritaceae cyanobacterium C42_A2020_066]|nr:TldD/PmbA family protein [Gloeomargaritaceae cyanobacterium C42_A2020_066]